MVSQRRSLLEGVGRDDDRRAVVLDLPQQVVDVEATVWIEPGGGFVEEDNLGSSDERRGEREPLLLATGQAADRRAREGVLVVWAVSATALARRTFRWSD